MRKQIKLSEKDLHRLIRESVRRFINESIGDPFERHGNSPALKDEYWNGIPESRIHRIVKESVRRALKEEVGDIKSEVEQFVREFSNGNEVAEWFDDKSFCDDHGFNGSIFNSEDEADNYVLTDGLQNAIDSVNGAQTEEDWISYLINGGVDEGTAEQLINNGNWEGVVKIILDKEGAPFFLSTYSGRIHDLSDGSLLYY